MRDDAAAQQSRIVSRDRVIDRVRTLLRTATVVTRQFTVEEIARLSGVELRAIRSYMANDPAELREPPLSAALSIAVVLGSDAINAVLALIGYCGAHPADEPDQQAPGIIVAELIGGVGDVAKAAADGHFDHIERPVVRAAADRIIAAALPLSSMAEAG